MDIVVALLAVVVGFLAGVIVNALADTMPYYRRPRLPIYPPDGSERPLAAWSGLAAFLMGKQVDPNPAPRIENVQEIASHDVTEGEVLAESAEVPPVVVPEGPEYRRLSWRHPIVEAFMALFFGFVVINWPNHERTIIWMIYLTILMLITVIDIEHYLILFPVIIPAVALAAVIAVVFPEGQRKTIDYFIGAALGGGVFLVMFWGGGVFSGVVAAARGEELEEVAFGFGDVLLATLCGLMIGWQGFIFAMLITVFLGAAGAIIYLIARLVTRSGYAMFTPLPYGPYIVIGTVIMMLWREEIRALLESQ